MLFSLRLLCLQRLQLVIKLFYLLICLFNLLLGSDKFIFHPLDLCRPLFYVFLPTHLFDYKLQLHDLLRHLLLLNLPTSLKHILQFPNPCLYLSHHLFVVFAYAITISVTAVAVVIVDEFEEGGSFILELLFGLFVLGVFFEEVVTDRLQGDVVDGGFAEEAGVRSTSPFRFRQLIQPLNRLDSRLKCSLLLQILVKLSSYSFDRSSLLLLIRSLRHLLLALAATLRPSLGWLLVELLHELF